MSGTMATTVSILGGYGRPRRHVVPDQLPVFAVTASAAPAWASRILLEVPLAPPTGYPVRCLDSQQAPGPPGGLLVSA